MFSSESDSSQDCQQQKPNDWKFWPQNCYWAKLVQDWLIQIRISSKIWSFFHNEEGFEPCFALDIWISHQIDERKWKRLRCARYSFGELSNIGSHIVHWTDEEIFHLMPAKNISWCKRKYLKVLLLEKNDAGFDWSNQQKRDCRLVIAKIFANYFVQFYLFYYWGPSWLDNIDLTHLHFFSCQPINFRMYFSILILKLVMNCNNMISTFDCLNTIKWS